jgi:XTP/dITP diphosphohydrolase
MKKVIFATGNQDKMEEIRSILSDWDMEIQSMREAGIDLEIVEDGQSFEENASIKARAVAAQLEEEGVVVFADDSGLEIDYLGKEPGIYSARYLGEDTPYKIKNQKILERMAGVPKEKRTARFVCAIAAADKNGEICVTRGTIEGYIGWEPCGANGFGYDPIFYLDEYGCSTAELSPELKNQLSHRGKALSAMRQKLRTMTL